MNSRNSSNPRRITPIFARYDKKSVIAADEIQKAAPQLAKHLNLGKQARKSGP